MSDKENTPKYRPILTPGELVQRKRQRWLWADVIPLNAPTLFAGRGGIGKSTVMAWLIAQLTQGKLPGDFYGEPVPVGIIAGEDDKEFTLEPRLAAAGANPRLWSCLEVAPDAGAVMPATLEHLDIIEQMIEETGLKVLIADPLISMQSGDSHKLSAVREELNPLLKLCQDRGISMLWVHHFNKATGDASNLISGSHAYRDIARTVLLLAEDEDTGARVLSVDKGNYIKDSDRKSWAFTIEDTELPVEGDLPTRVGRAVWQGESSVTVSDIVRRDVKTLGETRLEILDYAADKAGQLFTPTDAADDIGGDYQQVKKYLSRLTDAGDLAKPSRGKYTITEQGLAKINRQRLDAPTVENRAEVLTFPTPKQIGPTGEPLCGDHNLPITKGAGCAGCAQVRAAHNV